MISWVQGSSRSPSLPAPTPACGKGQVQPGRAGREAASCEGHPMPIMTAGAGRDPVEAMLGQQPWATECGEHLSTAVAAASSMDLTSGLPCQTQGLEACLEALPTTNVLTRWSDLRTCFSLLGPSRWKAPTLSPDSAPPGRAQSTGGRSGSEGGHPAGGPGHCLPGCPWRSLCTGRGKVFRW